MEESGRDFCRTSLLLQRVNPSDSGVYTCWPYWGRLVAVPSVFATFPQLGNASMINNAQDLKNNQTGMLQHLTSETNKETLLQDILHPTRLPTIPRKADEQHFNSDNWSKLNIPQRGIHRSHSNSYNSLDSQGKTERSKADMNKHGMGVYHNTATTRHKTKGVTVEGSEVLSATQSYGREGLGLQPAYCTVHVLDGKFPKAK